MFFGFRTIKCEKCIRSENFTEQIKVFQASVTSVYKEQESVIGKDLLDLFVAAGK